MRSWREGLGDAAQADLDLLLGHAIRLAQGNLAGASEFAPFPLVIDTAGRLLAVDLDTTALGKHPEPDELVAATAAHLRTLTDSVRCTALILNTRLSRERTDAVEVRLEHREGVALLVLLPYRRPRFGGTVDYGQPRVFPGERGAWV